MELRLTCTSILFHFIFNFEGWYLSPSQPWRVKVNPVEIRRFWFFTGWFQPFNPKGLEVKVSKEKQKVSKCMPAWNHSTGRFENFLAESFLFLNKTFYFWWKLFRFFENEIFGVLIKVASFNTFRITFLLRKIFRAEIYIPESFEKTF